MTLKERLRADIELLATIKRPSASDGERRAAGLLVSEFERFGLEARSETGPAHGQYWRPLALLSGLGLVAGGLGRGGRWRRLAASALGLSAAAGVWDDVSAGHFTVRRRLGQQATYNAIGEIGQGPRTLIIVAHHDAAKTGLLFHPAIPRTAHRLAPRLVERQRSSPMVAAPIFLGPLLAAAGSLIGRRRLRQLGMILSLGSLAALLDIGARPVSDGANDNLSGVAVLLELARRLGQQPPQNLRVILLSTGSEESFMEGMRAYAQRHFPGLDRQQTAVLCIDTVGSSQLCSLEGEGMLRMRDYDPRMVEALHQAASTSGSDLAGPYRLRNGTDGLYAIKYKLPAACLCSIDRQRVPRNYHWTSDTPSELDYDSCARAVDISEALLRRLEQQWLS